MTSAPVDAVATQAWSELADLAAASSPDLRAWFAAYSAGLRGTGFGPPPSS